MSAMLCPVCGSESFCDKRIHYAVACIHPACTMRGPCRPTEAEAVAAWNKVASAAAAVAAATERRLRVEGWLHGYDCGFDACINMPSDATGPTEAEAAMSVDAKWGKP